MQAERTAGLGCMPLLRSVKGVLWGSRAMAGSTGQFKPRKFGVLGGFRDVDGEGPGQWGRLLITGLLGKSHQELRCACDPEGCYLGHAFA